MSDAPGYNPHKVYDSISPTADRINGKMKDHSITIKPGYTGMCFQCQKAFIYRSGRHNDPTILCGYYDKAVTMPLDIKECNRFEKVGEISLYDLVNSTKVVDLGTPTVKVGFEPEKGDGA